MTRNWPLAEVEFGDDRAPRLERPASSPSGTGDRILAPRAREERCRASHGDMERPTGREAASPFFDEMIAGSRRPPRVPKRWSTS